MTEHSPDSSEATPLLYDPDGLLQRCMGDAALVEELLEIFQTESVTQMQALKTALDSSDADKIRFNAHAVKGSASYLGAAKVKELALEIEILGKAGNVDEAVQQFPNLENAFQLLIEQLQKR